MKRVPYTCPVNGVEKKVKRNMATEGINGGEQKTYKVSVTCSNFGFEESRLRSYTLCTL